MPNASTSSGAINPWFIAISVALAAFMEILDTSIANVALPYMAGSLAVTNDESTWILTSYLVSNAIVLPISGWLANRFGRKRFFMFCIVIFTLASICCGLAPNLATILICRVIQGAGGGALQPMAQAIMADSFPPEKRGQALAFYGLTAVFAPAVGPTLGGWLTYSYSWRWIFFINLPMGLLTFLLIRHFVQEPKSEKKADPVPIDYIGIALLVLGIGALQIMLDRGQQDDWFGSHAIMLAATTAIVCLVGLVIWEMIHKNPIIEISLFKSSNFAAACVIMFFFGLVLFGSLVMMPQFLQQYMGYTSELAGFVLSASGVMLLFEMPIVGKLTTSVPAKYLIAFGWFSLAMGLYYSAQSIDLEWSFASAQFVRVVQTIGIGFLFVPITLVSYVGLPKDKSNAASGMINFMRNMGASVGTSLVTTLVARRSQVHQDYLSMHLAASNPNYVLKMDALKQQLQFFNASTVGATTQATATFYKQILAQSAALAYIDTYAWMAAGSAVLFFLCFFLKSNDPGGKGAAPAEG